MKKIYSFTLIITAALSSLTSCKEDSLILEDEPIFEGPTSFVAYLENDATTRTTIDGLKISWENGDQINVNGSIYVADVDAVNPSKALFSLAEGQSAPTDGTLRAYYPASSFVSTTYTQRYKLQDTQVYNGNDVSTIDYMYAQTPNSAGDLSFTFKHVTGILALDLVGEEKVTSIQITAPTSNYLCGTISNFAYSTAGKISYSAFVTTGRATTVTLDCGEGVELDSTTPERFYISLPQKEYASLTIKINTASGESMTINSTKACNVTKGTLFTLPQITVTCDSGS